MTPAGGGEMSMRRMREAEARGPRAPLAGTEVVIHLALPGAVVVIE